MNGGLAEGVDWPRDGLIKKKSLNVLEKAGDPKSPPANTETDSEKYT